ncbi:MAG: PAS domain S-box protein [Acidobacteriota bacterium]|nr:PAS domain S-box protein [Acidobacteriota bacterium]
MTRSHSTMKLVELVRTLPADPGSFALLDAVPIGIFIVAADGRSVYTNAAAKELLGRDIKPGTTAEERAEFFHVHVAGTGAAYPPDRLPSMRALRGEHVRVMDMELRSTNRMIVVDCAAAPIEGPDGEIVGSVSTFSDVTDVARIERAYRMLFNNVPVGFYSVTPDGNFLVANPALRKILGYQSDEDLAQGNLENDHVKRSEHLVFRHQLEERGEVRGFETAWRRRDGNVVYVSLNATATRDENGAIVSYEGTVEDISDRKRTNEEVREARERYRQLVENANDIIYRCDAYGKFTYVNPTVRKILGYTEQELIGKHFIELIAPDHREAADAFYRVQFETKKPNTYFEFPVIAKNGEIVWMGQNVQTVVTGQWILGFQAVSRDISERKRMESELSKARDEALESARMKSEFLANMSHEIRTPMNGVIGMADILLGTRLTAEQKESAITIRRSAEALLTLVDDILDLAKIEAGKLTIKNANFDLDELIDSITDVFAERAAARGLKFRAVIYPDVHRHLNGDALRLRQVLLNLVGNAVKFTEIGEVSLSVMRESDSAGATELWFLVNDTGIGITQPDQDRLFTPFTQADGSTTRRFGGTGLGLAISKQLIDLMGGRIGVASVPGEGSTFWFTGHFEKDIDGEATSKHATLAGVRALLLDSNELNRLVLRRHLIASSISVEEVSSADAALDALRRAHTGGRPFDVVVLEMQLASTDGISVARTIRADPLIRETPMVLVTAIGRRKSDIEFFKSEGIDIFVMKPVRRVQLISALMQVIKVEAGAPARPAAEGGRLHTETGEEQQTTRKQILVVEDNIVNQKVAVGQLRNLGYDADVVGSGTEALEVIRGQSYDLILLDCQMPDIDGYDVARTIRGMETAGRHVPIVAMTAHTMDGEREKCLAAGMDDFLTKPVSMQRLGGVLVRWLGVREDVVDMEKMAGLQQLAKANPSFMRDITALFREDALVRLHELRDSLGGANADQVARAAHSLKSSSGNIGASRMYSLCATIESTAKQGNLDGIAEMVEQLASELDRALAALAQSAGSTDV